MGDEEIFLVNLLLMLRAAAIIGATTLKKSNGLFSFERAYEWVTCVQPDCVE